MSLTTSEQKQLTVFVTIHVSPSNAEALASAHREVWAACAREPECLLFDVFQDPTDKGLFRFIEVWTKDRKWFEEEQMTKDYYSPLWERSKPLWIEPINIEYFERRGEGCSYRQGYLDGGTKKD